MFTPYNNERKNSNVDMTISGEFPINNLSYSYSIKNNPKIRFYSLIAIGNPIVDISGEITKQTLEKYHLSFGQTVFANQSNVGFYQDLENATQVTYIPGGSIQNTLRVTAWCIFMNPENIRNFKLTMLGATGKDNYREKIIRAFDDLGVRHILQIIPNLQTSRCGVGIHQKERCLLPEIRASNCLTEEFVKENLEEIMSHEILLIEGYFLQEKYDICLYLCTQFIDQRKLVILTLSAVTIVQKHTEKVLEIANYSDIIVANMSELEAFAEVYNMDYKTTFEKASKRLTKKKDRLFLVTDGSKGAIVAKYDYDKRGMDFILQCFPNVIKMEDITDLNGAGDAFLGGFLSQYMLGKNIESCCKAGNDAASVILKNIGCTFNPKMKIQFS